MEAQTVRAHVEHGFCTENRTRARKKAAPLRTCPCNGATYIYDERARARALSRAASWNILFAAHPSADETG